MGWTRGLVAIVHREATQKVRKAVRRRFLYPPVLLTAFLFPSGGPLVQASREASWPLVLALSRGSRRREPPWSTKDSLSTAMTVACSREQERESKVDQDLAEAWPQAKREIQRWGPGPSCGPAHHGSLLRQVHTIVRFLDGCFGRSPRSLDLHSRRHGIASRSCALWVFLPWLLRPGGSKLIKREPPVTARKKTQRRGGSR